MRSVKADRYYDAVARDYDKKRKPDGTWIAENRLISKLVTQGPVLDVPFGTGRYVPHYENKGLEYLGIDISDDMLAQAKAKYPDANCRQGSVFDLPTGFKTVVCTRLLNWLYPKQMRVAMEQMCAAADTLVFTLRAGADGDRRSTATYTHSTETLKQLIGGRLWEQHRIGGLRHGEYIMVKACKPTHADVEKAFSNRAPGTLDTLLGEWSTRIGVERPAADEVYPLTVEWWTHTMLGDYVDQIRKITPAFFTKRPPKREDMPIIAFKRDGRYGMLDGRHRANLWRNTPGVYPVIVMEC